MNPKRLACAALATTLLIGQAPARALTGISDWAQASITAADQQALVPPTFQKLSATGAVTRQEFCHVLVRLYEAATLTNTGSYADDPEIGEGNAFSDTSDTAVVTASILGLVNGRGNGKFDPQATITRQELCVMLSNVLRAIDTSTASAAPAALEAFPDRSAVDSWAADDMSRMVDAGILSGTARTDGTVILAPLATATREQSVLLAQRFLIANPPATKPAFGEDPETDDSTTAPPNDDGDDKKVVDDDPDASTDVTLPPIGLLPDFSVLTESEKLALVFGVDNTSYTDEALAKAAMTQIVVPIWRLQSDGTKTSAKQTLTVNRTLSTILTAVFEEIYNGAERFPIKDAGGYAWRANTRSEHRQGTAIDLNWSENMECNTDGNGTVLEITAGSHWTPGEDPYSIPADGDVVRAFKSHGFSWGGDCWKTKRDYMHFSFFGR